VKIEAAAAAADEVAEEPVVIADSAPEDDPDWKSKLTVR
jgi:hypothetical protein